jgi:hypothetical protein
MSGQFDNALHLMEVQGGSFVKSLVACYYAADTANKATLRDAFSGYFDQYEARFRALEPEPEIACEACFRSGCNGECSGDGQMGD